MLKVHTIFMKCWHDYVEYLKDNPEGYWFKNKMYGYGWTPARWPGWIVLGVYLNLVIWLVIYAERNSLFEEEPIRFISLIAGMTLSLIAVCWRTGEPLKWNWGKSKEDKELE